MHVQRVGVVLPTDADRGDLSRHDRPHTARVIVPGQDRRCLGAVVAADPVEEPDDLFEQPAFEFREPRFQELFLRRQFARILGRRHATREEPVVPAQVQSRAGQEIIDLLLLRQRHVGVGEHVNRRHQ
jgi:hypothetical protein